MIKEDKPTYEELEKERNELRRKLKNERNANENLRRHVKQLRKHK